jgi:CubicO group peptidase (beta-lactamase class C family)
MRANRLNGQALTDFSEFGGWSKAGYGYGLGVRTLIDRERNNALSENGEFGWDGACGCYVVIDPAAEVALFYAQQEAGSKWWEWHGTVKNSAYASIWE